METVADNLARFERDFPALSEAILPMDRSQQAALETLMEATTADLRPYQEEDTATAVALVCGIISDYAWLKHHAHHDNSYRPAYTSAVNEGFEYRLGVFDRVIAGRPDRGATAP